MDADDRELVIRLCTKAGMLMEDASVVGVTSAGLDQEQLLLAVDSLGGYASKIKALICAASLLLRS
jgi:hypothetical protein